MHTFLGSRTKREPCLGGRVGGWRTELADADIAADACVLAVDPGGLRRLVTGSPEPGDTRCR